MNEQKIAGATKVDSGYVSISLLPNTWTVFEIPLIKKNLTNINLVNVTPIVQGYRMCAPVVADYSTDRIVLNVFSLESVAADAGFSVIAYGI